MAINLFFGVVAVVVDGGFLYGKKKMNLIKNLRRLPTFGFMLAYLRFMFL